MNGKLSIDEELELEKFKQLLKLEQEFARLNILYGADKVKRIMKATKCSVFEVEQYINSVIIDMKGGGYLITTPFSIGDCIEQCAEITLQDRITQLKSQLKHCKNPLQKLNIERELNRLYKNKK